MSKLQKALNDLENNSITRLDLSYNNIGDEGARTLADTLLKNTSLTSLDLRYNKIGDIGAKAFADALLKNTSLTSLYLGGNNDIRSTLTNICTQIIKRNEQYARCKLSLEMFFESADIPNELSNIINNNVLTILFI